MVSSGGCDSERGVKSRMSQNITLARTRRPPSAKPDCSRSRATSGAANWRKSSFCWSRRRFFSRLADACLKQHGIDGLVQIVLGAELDAAHDVIDALER